MLRTVYGAHSMPSPWSAASIIIMCRDIVISDIVIYPRSQTHKGQMVGSHSLNPSKAESTRRSGREGTAQGGRWETDNMNLSLLTLIPSCLVPSVSSRLISSHPYATHPAHTLIVALSEA